MTGTKENPIYSVYAISGSTKYNLSACVEEISFSDAEEQFSKKVQISLANVQANGTWLTDIFKVRDRIFIHADDGERSEEVWRGFIWDLGYKSSLSAHLLVFNCYDNLIFCQESEESEFFASGKSTESVVSAICEKWGIKLEYTYSSITHSKLVLRGKLSEIITADILDLVKDRNGTKYVILSEKDVMYIKPVGQNTTVYNIELGKNAIMTEAECTMDGMITKVVILGKGDDNARLPVEATLDRNTNEYGTLQKIINRDENTSLEDAKKEGNTILDKDAKPKWEYRVEAPDIPWVRKGDKVYVNGGNLKNYFIVKAIERKINLKEKIMTLTMEDE